MPRLPAPGEISEIRERLMCGNAFRILPRKLCVQAMPELGKKLKGFDWDGAKMYAVENEKFFACQNHKRQKQTESFR